jgi:hypothetical protein
MYPTTMTLLVYSVFRHVRTNSENVYCLHHFCLSICQHITAACIGRILVKFDSGGFMVIGILPPNLVEIGQLYRLLQQRHLSHSTAARIR